MQQLHHLIDGIIQVNASIIVCPSVFAGEVCSSQDKGIQQLCLVGERLIARCFKEEAGKLCIADGLLRLVLIDILCHSIYGQLEARFRGQAINCTAHPEMLLQTP